MPDVVLRVTARFFQKRFQQLDEPTLVNNGIYFPEVTGELLRIAEKIISERKR